MKKTEVKKSRDTVPLRDSVISLEKVTVGWFLGFDILGYTYGARYLIFHFRVLFFSRTFQNLPEYQAP